MKKQLHLFVVALTTFFMVSFSANAQENFSIGIKTEANSTFYKYTDESEYSNSTRSLGAGAGIFFKYEFNNWFALQTDLMYHHRNSEMENKVTTEKAKLLTV